ncbi:MAG: thiosulfate oxidation carrier protein SoxY [Gammaproteobacteria bacterium]|nr:thiosulfate oxidation carrier protein SoxY [Gammaproteobacteria bacterium]
MQRRTFLKGSLASSAIAVAIGAGLLQPRQVLAAWPKASFEAKNVTDAMTSLYGSAESEVSADITIKAPDIAENGAVVPVSVETSLPNVTNIGVIAEKNGTPMSANFILSDSAKGFVSTRIKMGKTSSVIAIVTAGGKTYSARKEVKVTIGGCGG